MKASIIKIGNSRGIRIPKTLLEEAKFGEEVDIKIQNGDIVISAPEKARIDEGILLSYSALAKEWNSPEEDAAWAYLQ